MTSLTSLIERVEAATEGSRELDKVIWLACTSGGNARQVVIHPQGNWTRMHG